MATKNPSTLGGCPFCSADVTTADVLIAYEKDGQAEVFAECPQCRDVVNPE